MQVQAHTPNSPEKGQKDVCWGNNRREWSLPRAEIELNPRREIVIAPLTTRSVVS